MVLRGNVEFQLKKRFPYRYKMVTYKMKTSYYIQEGQVIRKNDGKDHKSDGLFSLTKWLKKVLSQLNVAFNDPCCEDDPNSVPLRYNPTTSKIQRYNASTDTWTNVTTF